MHRHAVLAVLVLLYFFNFVDRSIVHILVEPIKADLGLSDGQLGILSGFAFAVLYTTLGVPIARLADRRRRVDIIAAAVTLWSAMTALCGLAQNFAQLALARVGVGVGEAGLTPPAHSMIADLYPEEQRGRAIAVYQMGVPAAVLISIMAGGFIAEAWGWRAAFLIVGLPGIALGVLVKLAIREPLRTGTPAPQPPFGESLRALWRIPAFRQINIAFALCSFGMFAFFAWFPAILGRVHGLGTAEVALWYGPINFVSGVAGAFFGGFLGDKLGAENKRRQLDMVGIATLIAAPLFAVVLFAPTPLAAVGVFFVPGFLMAMCMGPTFAMVQSLVAPRLRAMASSIVLFFANMIGAGAGPSLVGFGSDLLEPTLGNRSLPWAALLVVPVLIWCGIHYLAAGRTLNRDLERAEQAAVENGGRSP